MGIRPRFAALPHPLMKLSALICDHPILRADGPCDHAEITGLTDDSRAVQPGDLFICREADPVIVNRYVKQSVSRGASAVLVEPSLSTEDLALPDAVARLHPKPGVLIDQHLAGQVAQHFFGDPASRLKLIAVTGTNGKTTVATITQHLLNSTGHKCGLMGTVHLDTGSPDGPTPAELTTPGAIELTKVLAQMVEHGCTAVAMEASSHALEQGRTAHLDFAAACFTNLSQDHLDYHETMAQYADAKALLFESLGADATAVINAGDPQAERMTLNCSANILHSAVEAGGDAQATAAAINLAAGHSDVLFAGPWGEIEIRLPLVGAYNLSNALQAAALAHAVTGIQAEQLKAALEQCPPVPGRLEPVTPSWPDPPSAIRHPPSLLPTVLVDYAHTPDALSNVTRALRPLTQGKLIVVFGCGGDRDRAKRPLMAKAACESADLVVLTSDNPRTEDPEQILRDAEDGFTHGMVTQTRSILDRAQAIRFAIDSARPEDTVLIAGKGHEDYQVIGSEKIHFDDREQAAAALNAKRKIQH